MYAYDICKYVRLSVFCNDCNFSGSLHPRRVLRIVNEPTAAAIAHLGWISNSLAVAMLHYAILAETATVPTSL